MFYNRQRNTKILLIIIFILIFLPGWSKDTLQVNSPSGRIQVRVWMDQQLKYQVLYDNQAILAPSSIDLLLDKNRSLSLNNAIKSSSQKEVREQIMSPVPEKRRIIPDGYNVLSVSFKQPYKVDFRVYDDGVAYRMSTILKIRFM